MFSTYVACTESYTDHANWLLLWWPMEPPWHRNKLNNFKLSQRNVLKIYSLHQLHLLKLPLSFQPVSLVALEWNLTWKLLYKSGWRKSLRNLATSHLGGTLWMAAKAMNPVKHVYLIWSMKIHHKFLVSVATSFEQTGQGSRQTYFTTSR